MNKNELQNYIENNIPIVQKMGFSINEIGDDKVIVSGEYCTHINHTNSVFGGSISSIMTLAGWTRVKILSEEIDPSSTVIIQNNSTNFIKPVTEDYQVYTEKIELTEIKKLKKIYNKFGRGRIKIVANLTHKSSSEILAKFKGEFVILKDKI